jgi:hypothetical protein
MTGTNARTGPGGHSLADRGGRRRAIKQRFDALEQRPTLPVALDRAAPHCRLPCDSVLQRREIVEPKGNTARAKTVKANRPFEPAA